MGKGGISDDSSDVVVPLATVLERSRYLHLMHFLKNVHQHACNIFPFWDTYSHTSNTYTMIDQKNICEYLFVERSGRIVFQKIYSIHVRKFIYVFKQGSFQQMSMKKISILVYRWWSNCEYDWFFNHERRKSNTRAKGITRIDRELENIRDIHFFNYII